MARGVQLPQDSRSPFRNQRWVNIYNYGASTIPPFGCVEIADAYRPEDAGGPTVLRVQRPTADSTPSFMINGPMPVGVGEFGFATLDFPCYALYSGTPAAGQEWGPANGSYAIQANRTGVIIAGDTTTDLDENWVRVIGSRGSASSVIEFQLTANLSTGSSAAAVIRTFNGTTYVSGAAIVVFDWYGVVAGRGMFQAISGMEGIALKRPVPATPGQLEYDIIWMEQYARMVAYTMTSNFNSSGVATALVDKSWDQGVDPGSSITIYDTSLTFTDAIEGCQGIASRSEYETPTAPASPYYIVIRSQRAAERASAILASDMCGDTPNIDAGTWAIEPHGEETYDPGAPDEILNEYMRFARAGDIVEIDRLDKVPPFTWGIKGVQMHEAQHVSDVYWDEDAKCIKKKFFERTAIETCSEEDDTDVLCFDPCEV